MEAADVTSTLLLLGPFLLSIALVICLIAAWRRREPALLWSAVLLAMLATERSLATATALRAGVPPGPPAEANLAPLLWPIVQGYAAIVAVLVLDALLRRRDRSDADRRRELGHYRGIVDRAPAVLLAASANGDDYLSPRLAELLEFDGDALERPAELWRRQLHPQDRARVVADRTRELGARRPYAADYRLLTREGAVRWVHEETRPITAPDAASRVCGVLTDITERKQDELELIREREELERQAGDLRVDLDAIREQCDALHAQCTSLRDRRDELTRETRELSSRCDELQTQRDGLSHERDTLREERDDLDVQRHRLHGEGELLRTERDGLCEERDRLSEQRDGLCKERDGLARERDELTARCSDLEKDRDRLRIEARRLNTLMDRFPHLLLFKDHGGRCTRVSRSVAQLVEASSPERLIGATDEEVFGDLAESIESAGGSHSVVDRLSPVRLPSGAVRWYLMSSLPFESDDLTPGGRVAIGVDVTTMQASLRAARDEIRSSRLQSRELEQRHRCLLENLEEFAEAGDGSELARRLEQHIQWMSSVHAVVLDGHRTPRRLTELVQAITPSVPRITLHGEGEDVLIPKRQVAPFAALVHHLMVSSLGAGALSGDDGRVRIAWESEAGESTRRRLRFQWSERPSALIEVKPIPERATGLIEELAACLGGQVQLDGGDLAREHRISLILDGGRGTLIDEDPAASPLEGRVAIRAAS